MIGDGLEWSNSANAWETVNWQTVGYWASLRAAKPLATDDGYNFLRIDHSAPFATIKYWEVGNEEYGSRETDHHGTSGPNGVRTRAEHDPTTYAAFLRHSPSTPRKSTPAFSSASTANPTGASDNNWTSNVLKDGLSLGICPGLHLRPQLHASTRK